MIFPAFKCGFNIGLRIISQPPIYSYKNKEKYNNMFPIKKNYKSIKISQYIKYE